MVSVLAAAIGAAFRYRRRRPMQYVALLWVVAWLVPTYLLPIRADAVSERHAYPALWALGWLLAEAAAAVGAVLRRPQPVPGRENLADRRWPSLSVPATVLLCVLAGLAAQRNAEYRSGSALWAAAARTGKPTVRILNNLGASLIEEGRWEDAAEALEAARRIDPDHSTVAANLDRALRRSPD